MTVIRTQARPGPSLSLSGHALRLATFALAADGELPLFEERYVAAIGHCTLVLREKALPPGRLAELDAAAHVLCAQQAEAVLAELPSTLEEDETLDESLHESAVCGETDGHHGTELARLTLALQLRIAAKRTLSVFASRCRERARQLTEPEDQSWFWSSRP